MAAGPFYTPAQIKQVDDKVGIVRLISGMTAKGEEFYAYVSVKPSMFEEFCEKIDKGEPINVDSYGQVLQKGFGRQPSDDVKSYMEERFGIDHNFAETLTEAMKQEAARLEAANTSEAKE